MKATEKEKSSEANSTQKSKFMSIVDEQNSSNFNGNSQLIERIEVENTPFIIIHLTEKNIYFGTFGQYKITEDYETLKVCKEQLTNLTWNRIIQIMTLVHTLLNNQKI